LLYTVSLSLLRDMGEMVVVNICSRVAKFHMDVYASIDRPRLLCERQRARQQAAATRNVF
jgi:hypothetical protein